MVLSLCAGIGRQGCVRARQALTYRATSPDHLVFLTRQPQDFPALLDAAPSPSL